MEKKSYYFSHIFSLASPELMITYDLKSKVTPNRNLQGGKTGVGNLDGSFYERLLVKLK